MIGLSRRLVSGFMIGFCIGVRSTRGLTTGEVEVLNSGSIIESVFVLLIMFGYFPCQ